jgi:hypothetical protein
MRLSQLLGALLLTGPLFGCVYWVTAEDPPEMFTNHDLLWPMIGQKQESVVRKLGSPNEGSFQDGDKLFMVYSDRGVSTSYLIFLFPGGGGPLADNELLSCLRIELDSDYLVKGYQVKSKFFGRDLKCPNMFWSEEELTNFQQLRANQLYSEKVGSVSTVKVDGDEDISGIYVSEITSLGAFRKRYFRKDEYRKLEITLKQTNNIVTGTDSFGTGTIKGTRTGDMIQFTYWSPNSRISNFGTLHGKWKIKRDGSTLEGSWFSNSSGGSWNLTRVE